LVVHGGLDFGAERGQGRVPLQPQHEQGHLNAQLVARVACHVKSGKRMYPGEPIPHCVLVYAQLDRRETHAATGVKERLQRSHEAPGAVIAFE
jgi:hypothetical protein